MEYDLARKIQEGVHVIQKVGGVVERINVTFDQYQELTNTPFESNPVFMGIPVYIEDEFAVVVDVKNVKWK